MKNKKNNAKNDRKKLEKWIKMKKRTKKAGTIHTKKQKSNLT